MTRSLAVHSVGFQSLEQPGTLHHRGPSPSKGGGLDRGIQDRTPALGAGHAITDRLRIRPQHRRACGAGNMIIVRAHHDGVVLAGDTPMAPTRRPDRTVNHKIRSPRFQGIADHRRPSGGLRVEGRTVHSQDHRPEPTNRPTVCFSMPARNTFLLRQILGRSRPGSSCVAQAGVQPRGAELLRLAA